MGQRGTTFLEVLICVSIIGVLASGAVLVLGSSVANQELVSCSLQLVSDIRYLQQLVINGDPSKVAYLLVFYHVEPYGYDLTANGQIIKHVNFPLSVKLSDSCVPIGFSKSGAPAIGSQSIGLQSIHLKTWKYVILSPVTGRVRISDTKPKVVE